MDRPEWGAVNPLNGEVYFTLTNNSDRRDFDDSDPVAQAAGDQGSRDEVTEFLADREYGLFQLIRVVQTAMDILSVYAKAEMTQQPKPSNGKLCSSAQLWKMAQRTIFQG